MSSDIQIGVEMLGATIMPYTCFIKQELNTHVHTNPILDSGHTLVRWIHAKVKLPP
jgi:Mn2+/Fe2+ NRAMP family transporter